MRGPRPRVLLIEDEGDLRTLIAGWLSHRYEVVETGDAASALEILRTSGPFAAILCDVLLPGMDGRALHRALAETDPRAARRMAFMTGACALPEVRDFLEALPNPWISKPFAGPKALALLDRVTAEAEGR